eukprot:CAMPEP_0204625094 /NCGR_PEP_ID=MMETSP0717-20131115/10841_1 /ASSEMBLY_ACC=CAM_ASM_000666 /TAXON_ID=230516 /ORGANISM="Chaetoceros curvisetus" /LENGTH=84 /DNA_ID=CAMNT_0051640701 /DNA_START=723 /DNA_END=977 /DNA_ORIENTATION=+
MNENKAKVSRFWFHIHIEFVADPILEIDYTRNMMACGCVETACIDSSGPTASRGVMVMVMVMVKFHGRNLDKGLSTGLQVVGIQ